MAITFEQTPLRWENTGTEPSESLKENGYSAGMKPAANTFNYQINNASACLTELQTEVSELDTALNTLNEQAIKGIRGNGELITPDSSKIVNLSPYNIGAATASHEHSAADITLGTLPIERGGTGATSAYEAGLNLGVYKETSLYSSNGANGTITLSDKVSNYDYLEIYYKENNGASFYCIKVAPTFQQKWSMDNLRYSGTDGYFVFNTKVAVISGSTISFTATGYANIKTSPTVRVENNLYILKVKGYKKLI